MQNAEYRNNVIPPVPLTRRRRYQSCSFCRSSSHNIMRCNADLLREFELECATICHTIDQGSFKNWLTNTHGANRQLIVAFSAAKCGVLVVNQDISICIDSISTYIYRQYRWQFGVETFEDDMINVLTGLNQVIPEEQQQEQEQEQEQSLNMEASLINDLESALLFTQMMERIREERILSDFRRQKIDSILEELIEKDDINKQIECNICYESYNNDVFVKLGCNHEFCKDCVKNILRANPCCAYCRTNIDKLTSKTQDVHTDLSELIV